MLFLIGSKNVSFQWKSRGMKWKHERTPSNRLYVCAYVKNLDFLRSVIRIYWTSLVLPVWRLFNGNTFSKISTRKNYNQVTSFHWLVTYYLLSTGDQTVLWRVCMDRTMWECMCMNLKYDRIIWNYVFFPSPWKTTV